MGTDSRAAGALLARARTLHLQTGNLLNWGRLRKKCPSTHSEEVRAETRGSRAGRGRAGRLRGWAARCAPGLCPREEAEAAVPATWYPELLLGATGL